MQTTVRPYALVGAVPAATGIAAAAPLVPRSSQLRVLSTQVRLLDSDSVFSIPVNLFDDIVNIPANEVAPDPGRMGHAGNAGTQSRQAM